MPICIKSIFKCVLLISFSLVTSCSLFESRNQFDEQIINGSVFSKAQTLILAHDYENALPFIKRSLEAEDKNYYASLLLAARAYDQLAQPEQAILSLQEYLQQNLPAQELMARSLLLKNQAKVKNEITSSDEKKRVLRLAQSLPAQDVLNALAWSLDFRCDLYCVEEISFLQEIQLTLLYIVEKNTNESTTASRLIKDSYNFFNNNLNSETLSSDYKKSLAAQLLRSLKKLQALDLVSATKNRHYPSKSLLIALTPIEKNLESWQKK